MNVIDILGIIQNNGGMMILVIYLLVEVRGLRHDFTTHEKVYHSE